MTPLSDVSTIKSLAAQNCRSTKGDGCVGKPLVIILFKTASIGCGSSLMLAPKSNGAYTSKYVSFCGNLTKSRTAESSYATLNWTAG